MTLDLTDDEKTAPFPHAPRLDPLKAILAKLEPPKPQPEPLPSGAAAARALAPRP